MRECVCTAKDHPGAGHLYACWEQQVAALRLEVERLTALRREEMAAYSGAMAMAAEENAALRAALADALVHVDQYARRLHGYSRALRVEDCERGPCGDLKRWRALVSASTAASDADAPEARP